MWYTGKNVIRSVFAKEYDLRLLFQSGRITAQFNIIWEVAQLADYAQDIDWVPLYVDGINEPIGKIHTQSYEVHLIENHGLQHRQVVRLGPDRVSRASRSSL